MHVEVVKPEELGSSEAGLWAKFQQASAIMSNPFLSLTFARTVGRARSNARVAVVEESGKIEAFLPFELNANRVGVPIGGQMNDLQGLVGSGAPVDVRSVVRQAGLRGWRFYHAPAVQRALVPHHYEDTTIPCPVIDLSEGYTSYMASRSKSLSKGAAQQRRALERQVGPVSFEWSASCPEYLRQLFDWKSEKYDATQQLLRSSTPRRITEELATANEVDCRGVVSVMFAAERPVAINLALQGPRGLAGWFAAYNHDVGRFSPGTMILLAVAEEAFNRGVMRFDLGYGQHSYKFRLSNDSYPVAGGAVWTSRTEGVARNVYRRIRSETVQRDRTAS